MVASVYAADENSYASDVTQFNIDAPPGGWQVGDVVAWNAVIAASTPRTFTLRDGTTTLTKTVLHGPIANDSSWGEVAYHVLTAVPSGTLNILINAAVQGSVAWQVLRGVDLTQPVEAFVVSSSSGSTPHTLPSLTTGEDYCLITGGIIQGSGSAEWTAPSPWVIQANGTRRNGIVASRGVLTPAGSTGPTSWVMPGGENAAAQIYQVAWNSAEAPEPPIEATLTADAFPGASGDVADGACIIPNPTTPGNSVVIGTNKDSSGGLYVYDMAGDLLSSVTGFAANSVDWRDTTGITGWDGRILVMTTDRNSGSFGLRFYWFNRATRTLTLASTASLGYEPYGTCLGAVGGNLYAYVSERGPDDVSPRNMYQYLLTRSGDSVSIGSAVRTVNVANVVEGMVVDDDSEGWFCSQEDVGLFRYSALATGGSSRTTVDLVGTNLVADVEDVAIADTADGKKLLVSSQGDNSYHVYDLATFEHELRFTINRPGGGSGVTGTEGLDVYIGNLGSSFPNGLIVVHDDGLDPSRFQFVDAELVFGEAAIPGTISTVAGEATAGGGVSTFVGGQSAVISTVAGEATAGGGVSTFSGAQSGTISTVAGEATAGGGVSTFSGAASAVIDTVAGGAVAEGGVSTFAGGAASTLTTLPGEATAGGGSSLFRVEGVFATTAGEAVADGGTADFVGTQNAFFTTLAGSAVASGTSSTFLIDGLPPDKPEVPMSTLGLAELEIAYLRAASGATDDLSLADLRMLVYGADERAYFATLSGLTPEAAYSLVDHMLAFYRGETGLSDVSLVDAARAYWVQELAP